MSRSCRALLKAALRIVDIEPPKIHDVGPILRRNSEFFPEWFRENINRMATISRTLRQEREVSMYGDEELSLPPEEIYSEEDGKFAVESCEFVLENCKKNC
nr:HEPN domain-containing protein [Geoglobus ahangari]